MKMTTKNKSYYNDRIESMFISKIASLRLDIRDKFRTRHSAQWPELLYMTILGDIRSLRMWLYLSKMVYETEHSTIEPYAVYMAKQLTNDSRRNR